MNDIHVLNSDRIDDLTCLDASRTQQSFADECDINRIMSKFRKTGELNHLAKVNPTYGDFSSGADYKESLDQVKAAQADFGSLSAEIRSAMDNNPAVFLEFMADPENEDAAREMGLLAPLETPAPPPPSGPDPKGATASESEASPPPGAVSGGE